MKIHSCFDLMWHMIMEGNYDESKVALVATIARAIWVIEMRCVIGEKEIGL